MLILTFRLGLSTGMSSLVTNVAELSKTLQEPSDLTRASFLYEIICQNYLLIMVNRWNASLANSDEYKNS